MHLDLIKVMKTEIDNYSMCTGRIDQKYTGQTVSLLNNSHLLDECFIII